MTEHTNAKTLKGIRVVNASFNVPGPMAAARLATLGAHVTKIEPPQGDPLHATFPDWYRRLSADQKIVSLDLKNPQERKVLDTYLKDSDLLITASRPSSLVKLELDFKHLHGHFPKLCQIAIVGDPPPHENRLGHDLNFQAAKGLLDPPQMPRVLVADAAGAERAVSEALRLLLAREMTGKAGYSLVSISEAVEAFGASKRYGLTEPGAKLGGSDPGYFIYETAEGYIALGALEPHFMKRLCERLDISAPSHSNLQKEFKKKTALAWEAWGLTEDIPMTAVQQSRKQKGSS